MYDPCELSRTVFDAALSLKLKITDKVPKLKFPPYVKDKHEFALKFYLPKFSPLTTCELDLDFQLPPLLWYFCGSLSALEN